MRQARLRTISCVILTLLTLLGGLSTARPAHAVTERCFPETGQCLDGRFRQYWEDNGGLSVFGFPMTGARDEVNRDTGQTYLTQWLERNRFEAHPENAPPYDVLLGRLGDDLLLQQGRRWQDEPRETGPRQNCLWFPQTGRNVCDQMAGRGFRSYWSSHGLKDPRLNSFEASLALFGLPLTTARTETNSSGDTVLTQWFERARFEWHPNNPAAFQVLLGRLGAEALAELGGGPTVFTRANIYLIALEDNGQSGPKIGCNDSVIPVVTEFPPTTAPLTAALERMLAMKDQFFGESGLYNALYQSDLRLERAAVENGRATIRLTGQLRLGGVCDNPRVEAQIAQTALQFSSVREVAILLNGRPLADVLSGR